MYIKTKAIVLSCVKYRDNDLIVKCLTEQKGIVSYLVRGVSGSKLKGSKRAYFQLLSQLFIEQNFRETQSLQSIKELKVDYHYRSIHLDLMKSAITMFLAELLSTVLKEEEANKPLFNYIQSSLQYLDHLEHFANFHLLFLLNLTKPLGFYPDTVNKQAAYFHLDKGQFKDSSGDHYSISGQNLKLLKALLGMDFEALDRVKLNSNQRQSFLSMLLLYFELHLGTFKKPKSLLILNQVFN